MLFFILSKRSVLTDTSVDVGEETMYCMCDFTFMLLS